MGKKRRGGVVWSQDASSGSPLGQDIAMGWSVRTTKRTQKRDEISIVANKLSRHLHLKKKN